MQVLLDKPWSLHVRWEDHAQALLHELAGRGHEVRRFGLPRVLLARGNEVGTEDGELSGSPELRSSLAAFEPDVIVAYESRSSAALRGARVARRLGAAFVVVEPAWIEESGPARWFSRVGRRLWGGTIRSSARAVVALDPLARERAIRSGFPAERITVVRYGIDLAQFRPGLTTSLVARHRVGGRVVLYVGRLLADRGLDVLIRAFGRTVGQRADWSLVIAGDGPERANLLQAATRVGIADRLFLFGAPKPAELPGLLGAATLFAFPAVGLDGTARQVMRAMACGLPGLISDLPRLAGTVEHEATGLVVPPGDEAAWAEALRRATSSPETRKRWGVRARQVAEERFGWNVVGERLETLFRDAALQAALVRQQRERRPA